MYSPTTLVFGTYFTTDELYRLTIYRSAVRNDFYNEGFKDDRLSGIIERARQWGVPLPARAA